MGMVNQKRIKNPTNNLLPAMWDQNMESEYQRRLADVYARPRFTDKLVMGMRHYGGRFKAKISRTFG
jgi:hypothetical protein